MENSNPSGQRAAPVPPYYRGAVSDHFDGERFFNPEQPWSKTFVQAMRALVLAPREPWPGAFPSPFRDRPPARVDGGRLRVALVGHATLLLQTRGLNILTDPVWSERASPFPFAGPRRVNPPGIALDELPPIDVVLVTHNHYDHLDLPTLAEIARRHRPRIVTPLGNDTIMARGAALEAEAYDWGDRVALSDDVAVTLMPAVHWSARGVRDRRMALWAAFVIETPDGAIYHIGDTGFGDGRHFADVGRRFGPIRHANLPIGAYEPRWFMRDQHVEPAEAVKIFQACGAASAAGHHWGTFRLTAEGIERPPQALARALPAAGIAPERFRALRPGEVMEVPALENGTASLEDGSPGHARP
ncbi:MBL fold metallo-hydrolase [Chelatococcus reniformis]|uniref:Membrane protein n=1 Tax=Chelatococcus reniformis TaxID=1494448 RepID=A0A916TX49_9HYPH|nr:MBL fold metallo-hydrolase [Chelatococcus reniformis]GGC49689.1 membrane protein [Chelatococcus reniformis]